MSDDKFKFPLEFETIQGNEEAIVKKVNFELSKLPQTPESVITLDKEPPSLGSLGQISCENAPAFLIQEKGPTGAIKIFNEDATVLDTIETGPHRDSKLWVIIMREPVHNCRLYGDLSSTVRYFITRQV